MLAVSVDPEDSIELGGYKTPMLGAVVVDQLYEFFVLSLCPVALLNGRLFVLIELVLAL